MHDAEAVLLVDNDHAEAVELHVLIQQGVGADQNGYFAVGDALQEFLAAAAFDRAGEQRHLEAQMLQQGAQGCQVLLRQEFRGRHEGGLLAVGHRQQHGEQGDDGLAAANVALNEAVHRKGAAHVGKNLVQHAPLGSGELKRQMT